MPQLFCGFYLTGEGQLGGYHPLHWLLYRFLPLPAAFAWELLLSYPLMMVGTWLFLRRLLNNSPAAAAGSLWFAFCGFNLLHLVHPNAVAIIAHIPWLLWSIDVVLVDARRRRVMAATVLIALLTGSQLLLGYPQYVWFSLLIEGGYAAFVLHAQRFASRRECDQCADLRRLHRLCHRHLAAAGDRPSRRTVAGRGSARAHARRLVAQRAAGGRSAICPLGFAAPGKPRAARAPYLFVGRVAGDNTHEFALYLGAVPLTLIAWLAVRRGELHGFKPLVRAAGALAILALVMALGENGPLYRVLAWLPLFRTFRFPCRYVVLVQFSACVLAAVGFMLLLREHQRPDEYRHYPIVRTFRKRCLLIWSDFKPLWSLAAASGVVAVVGLTLRHETYIASIPLIVTGPALFLVAAVLVIMAARGYRAAMVGLILFAAADQGCYGLTYVAYLRNTTFDQWLASARTPPQSARWPRSGNLVGLQRARLAHGKPHHLGRLVPRRRICGLGAGPRAKLPRRTGACAWRACAGCNAAQPPKPFAV